MNFQMIDPNNVSADTNILKMGLDSKGMVNFSLSEIAAERIGLKNPSGDESMLAQLGTDGATVGIFAAPEGAAGFEVTTQKNKEGPRYLISIPLSGLYPNSKAEPFRQKIVGNAEFITFNGVQGVSVNTEESLSSAPEQNPEPVSDVVTPPTEADQEVTGSQDEVSDDTDVFAAT